MHHYQSKTECVPRSYMREDENPELVKYVEDMPEGSVFQLFGRTYRRQNHYHQGDTVLYVVHSTRFYLGKGGSLLINGESVAQTFCGLRFACVKAPDNLIQSEYYASGELCGFVMQHLTCSDELPTRIPIGVLLS